MKTPIEFLKAQGYSETITLPDKSVVNPTFGWETVVRLLQEYSSYQLSTLYEWLEDEERNDLKLFIDVCNEPLPEGHGKEYLFGMIKMKAFMAGRVFESEKIKNHLPCEPSV